MKTLRRLLPDTLGGRIVLVLLVGLVAFHLGSLRLHQIGTEAVVETAREGQLAERLVAAKRAILEQAQPDRERTAHALSSASLDLHWTEIPSIRASNERSSRITDLRDRLATLVPELDTAGLRLGYAGENEADLPHLLLGAIPLPDGSWLNFSAALFRTEAAEHATLLSTSAMAAGILVLGLVVVRIIGRPLRALSDAADRIGGTGPPSPIAEEGPREVRHAAQAFNRMQARIDRLIADRTQALAAVSHDLRTPLARLRLRAGFVEDAETARAIDADLDEMAAMIDGTLAYLRGEAESELRRPADLVAILTTLCDAATDAGALTSFAGPPQARLLCRPLSLKRAFANLIDNALIYGGTARVRVDDLATEVVIHIDDDGPGIPDAEMSAVFEPFHRLEASRNRGTGGSGLGLTIARQAVDKHGGIIELVNREAGGLSAVVRLPRRS